MGMAREPRVKRLDIHLNECECPAVLIDSVGRGCRFDGALAVVGSKEEFDRVWKEWTSCDNLVMWSLSSKWPKVVVDVTMEADPVEMDMVSRSVLVEKDVVK